MVIGSLFGRGMYFLQMSFATLAMEICGSNRDGDRMAKGGGTSVIPRLQFGHSLQCGDSDFALQIELVLALFLGLDKQAPTAIGIRKNGRKEVMALQKGEFEVLQSEGGRERPKPLASSSSARNHPRTLRIAFVLHDELE
jgi:hypothetical protein